MTIKKNPRITKNAFNHDAAFNKSKEQKLSTIYKNKQTYSFPAHNSQKIHRSTIYGKDQSISTGTTLSFLQVKKKSSYITNRSELNKLILDSPYRNKESQFPQNTHGSQKNSRMTSLTASDKKILSNSATKK